MNTDQAPEDLLTLRQAAEKLDCHPDTIRRAIREGRIAGEKVRGHFGAEWRVSQAALDDYIRAATPGQDMSGGVHGSLSPIAADLMSSLMRGMQGLAGPLHKVHKALEQHSEQQDDQHEVLATITERLAEQPQLHELISQVGSLQRQVQERDRENTRLQEELAAERRTTWWHKLLKR